MSLLYKLVLVSAVNQLCEYIYPLPFDPQLLQNNKSEGCTLQCPCHCKLGSRELKKIVNSVGDLLCREKQLLSKTEAGLELFMTVFVQRLLSIDNEMLV